MFKKFLKQLAEDVYYADTNRDTDHPTCPNCGGNMTFHGGNLSYGNGYWDCERCTYNFTENDINKYL